ncbi:aminoacyl-histidine dipeptidase [Dechloromonas sp. A34]|uniref:aminoacyl-histidine dipeptidase n=1 Tax=Dechloromonas sp. A34 TaxID=447588 RepID=UPI002248D348|nr:aminoacyl-histidine dipeptidase [Dechloromonas sp. A34]
MPSSNIDSLFSGLQPSTVWAHFATLCAIPRASKQEGVLRDRLQSWAGARGLNAAVDAAGNLIVRKPASLGREACPGIVLQAHLDMVCQKNADSRHDFSADPIRPVVRDDWLAAEGTTLGADNGIGVALILAVLEDKSLVHGPLEALLTVDEEAGMGGARGLATGVLQGSQMLNLDTEEWGEFYLGCAGGLDVNVERAGSAEPLPAGYQAWQISLRGLRGGHSGVNIHEERGNAIKLLVRVLRELETRFPLRLAGLLGGSARNALPREAFATLALPTGAEVDLAECLGEMQSLLRLELSGVDEGLALDLASAQAAPEIMSVAEQEVWLASLHAAPHGVRRMSRQVPGVVETSNNLGMVDLHPNGGSCNFMVRSLLDSGSLALADEIVSLFALSGTAAEKSGYYPGWAPNPGSPLLALCRSVFKRDFGSESRVQVIHAGLECGIIGAKYPGLDIVSFGPTIHGAHAPGESVEISSVDRCWALLKAILAEIR